MIDVIMPTYNRAQALTKVMDSYLSQDFLGKIIFVDDCSTDTTTEYVAGLAQQYPGKIVYHRMDKKSTLPNIRNVGIHLATNDYIFMGEDDVYLPEGHFKILLEKMNEYQADLISGRRVNMFADQDQVLAKKLADLDHRPVFVNVPFEAYFERVVDKAQSVNRLHSNMLMKRSVFDKVQYDPWYGGNAFREETDFFLRVWDAGFTLWLIPDTLSYHMKNTAVNQTGGSRKKRWVYEWQVWKNTAHLFIKNKKIFTEKLHSGNIYWYLVRCLIARYTYGLFRFIEQQIHRKKYAQT
ncbi:MAG: glycosyltransferase family 2 protein [bacterium]